ncbi:MAG: UDP-N-acetylmuramoyl-L-alanine--D-glutamate ligase [Chitinophagaceae bacterium]|jgi:UDP-N-acetylmuramoylalanine--D-glutamate ligase|nr:UDP-N-acetylmuramoyl-L-alanine--D-glutamate ligase [Chitinophagaceae bacterium]
MNQPESDIQQLETCNLQPASRFVILGAGESGVGAALLAKKNGYKNILVSDGGNISEKYKQELIDNQIEFEEGGHSEDKVLSASEIVKSPGIPEKNELIKKIRAKNIPVISEIELAYRFKGDSKSVAITGSNGKSTVTSLIYHICKTANLDCALVGNIGYSFAKQIAEAPKPLYIAEISSFQLDDIKTFRPDIALLLNITEDHLDRYEYKFENYVNSKFRIIENQLPEDYFIYCADDPVIENKLKTISLHTTPLPFTMKQEVLRGGYIINHQMMLRVHQERVLMNINDFVIKGRHNQYNTMAAGVAALALSVRDKYIREAMQTFESLEHRMQYVASIRGVEFINDSKATNLNSVWYALDSMNKPTVLILGGRDKGNDYTLIEDEVRKKVKAIVCLGIDNAPIVKAFENIVPTIETNNMYDAVHTAYRLAEKGDTVLLSPACASFDLFKNFMDRGEKFCETVKNL